MDNIHISEPYFYEYYINLKNQLRLVTRLSDEKRALLNLETNVDISRIIYLLENTEYIYRLTLVPSFKKIDNKQYCVKIVLQINFSVDKNHYYMSIINRDCPKHEEKFIKINLKETDNYIENRNDIIFSPSYYFGYKCFIEDKTHETRREIENVLLKVKIIKDIEEIIGLLSIFYYYRKLIRKIDFEDLKNININDIESPNEKAFDKKIMLSLETELKNYNIYEFFREVIGDIINDYKYGQTKTHEKIEYIRIVKEYDLQNYKYYETIIKNNNDFFVLIYEEENFEISVSVKYKIYEKESYEKILDEYRGPGLYLKVLEHEVPELKSYNYEYISNFLNISRVLLQ